MNKFSASWQLAKVQRQKSMLEPVKIGEPIGAFQSNLLVGNCINLDGFRSSNCRLWINHDQWLISCQVEFLCVREHVASGWKRDAWVVPQWDRNVLYFFRVQFDISNNRTADGKHCSSSVELLVFGEHEIKLSSSSSIISRRKKTDKINELNPPTPLYYLSVVYFYWIVK